MKTVIFDNITLKGVLRVSISGREPRPRAAVFGDKGTSLHRHGSTKPAHASVLREQGYVTKPTAPCRTWTVQCTGPGSGPHILEVS